jgi:hypothetical protein
MKSGQSAWNPIRRFAFTGGIIISRMAWSLLRTEESIATPCSVNAKGGYRRPPQDLEVTICDLKIAVPGLTCFDRMGRMCSRTVPPVKTTDIPFGRQTMTNLRRLLRNVPVLRCGAASTLAVLIVAF